MKTNLFELNKVLTEREMEIYLYAYYSYLDNFQIARKMDISIHEVMNVLATINKKLFMPKAQVNVRTNNYEANA